MKRNQDQFLKRLTFKMFYCLWGKGEEVGPPLHTFYAKFQTNLALVFIALVIKLMM